VRSRLVAAVVIAAALGACGGDPDGPTRFTIGQGAASATVVVPEGGADGRLGVVFLHGWGQIGARDYGPWVDHLVARGHVVILPRYQQGAFSPPPASLPNAVIGVRSALARVDGLRGLVAAGHSAGGALAADLAALAPRAGIPRPRAVFSVYPGRSLRRLPARIPPGDLASIPRTTRVEAWAGDDDALVGTRVARQIARATGGRYVLVRDDAVDDHQAPQRADAPTRRTFWRALDRLIERAG
jgi:acetyl esterase/lipase